MKNTIFVIIAFTILFIRCNDKKDLSSHTEFKHEETELYLLDAKYPEFKIDKLNEEINITIKKYVEESANNAKEEKNEEWFKPYELAVTNEVEVALERYVSVVLQQYYYAGGAHGMTFNKTIVYDSQTDEFKNINDIINQNQSDLIDLVKDKLKKKIGDGNFVDEGIEGIENLNKFVLTNKGVKFIFNPYEVAAYMHGSVSITVNYNEYQFKLENKK